MKSLSDKQIVASWMDNVQPWVAAIKKGEIESRMQTTNKVIVDCVSGKQPDKVLDVGCGEGWLVRTLAQHGIDVLGIDAVPALLEAARSEGSGRYQTLAYEEVSETTLTEKFDVVVANFSLLGKESVENLFEQVPRLLNRNGAFIVQTIHPVAGCGEGEYEDGWREGSWAGFSRAFTNPAPWYFRTIESWQAMFTANGFKLSDTLEPCPPGSTIPASIVFVGELSGR